MTPPNQRGFTLIELLVLIAIIVLAAVITVPAIFCHTEAPSKVNDRQTGTERHGCFPNYTCNTGLVCASDLCVHLPVPDAGWLPAERP